MAIPSVFLRLSRSVMELFVKTKREKAAGNFDGRTFFVHYCDGTSRFGWLGNGTIFLAAIPDFGIWRTGILGLSRMERPRGAGTGIFKHGV